MFVAQFNANRIGMRRGVDGRPIAASLFDRMAATLVLLFVLNGDAQGADRTTFFLPLPSDSASSTVPPNAVFADQAMGGVATVGWKNYVRLWRAHHRSPSDPAIRKYLGLPLKGAVQATSRRGRSAPRWMQWRPGTFQQVDTPHFTIYSHADDEAAIEIAEDLEKCYWAWTQMFFPHWEASAQVTTTLAMLGDQNVSEFLAANSVRITIRRKLRVVLFRDAEEYQKTLGPDVPGIERSTGFYNDDRQTIFLYASDQDDAATRRHELVHQLFREATRSTLGKNKPGEESDFWIVEGVAGYFESLKIGDAFATVGGWDASRLQFARYRMLAGRDTMTIQELRADGRQGAQQRSDLARWYAHAIAQSHHLLDSGDSKERIGYYQLLNRTYAIKNRLSGGKIEPRADQRLLRFLSISDQDLGSSPVRDGLAELCLSGCEITSVGLDAIPPSAQMRWLDLSRLPVGDDAVKRLVPNTASLQQLSLEATKVTTALNSWLADASRLTEVDLSFTRVDDSTVKVLSNHPGIEVLWLTGSLVGDASIDAIGEMKNLQAVDVQRSKVTPAGIQALRQRRPKLSINPIELRSE